MMLSVFVPIPMTVITYSHKHSLQEKGLFGSQFQIPSLQGELKAAEM